MVGKGLSGCSHRDDEESDLLVDHKGLNSWVDPNINKGQSSNEGRSMVGKGLSGCSHRDDEESDLLAVGDLRLVGSTLLEHQVLAVTGGGVGAERE